ncbi:MAG: helix-turn-helix transcriptional regulator [Thainema sp.]
MAIKLTDADYDDMMAQFEQQGEPTYRSTELGFQCQIPTQWGSGLGRVLMLRNGLTIQIGKFSLKQPVHHIRQHETAFPLVAKFYLSGASRVRTLDASDIDNDYQEVAGRHYLYHLPDLTEIEEYPADKLLYVIDISADPAYFSTFRQHETAIAKSLQKLLDGDRTQRFHQPLGRITPLMRELLKQLLNCPYHGLMQQLYLESKALELFAAQFSIWTDEPPVALSLSLCDQDLEQIHHAKDILLRHSHHPPSLTDLARQVGLNDRKLNRGFRQLFGTTVFGYLQDYRLQQAQQLLRDPALTIASVAATVGYTSPEAFSTAFRRKFAVSPKAYQLSQRA